MTTRKQYIATMQARRQLDILKENSIIVKEKEEQNKERERVSKEYEKHVERGKLANKHREFVTSVKEYFLCECIHSIFNESLNIFDRLSEKQKLTKRALVENFVKEQGVDKLLNKFKNTNALLSEFALITKNASDKVLESVEVYNKNSWTIDSEVKDKFTKDLANCNSKEAIITITSRVTDAEAEFVNDYTKKQLDIENILQDKKEKLDAIADKSEDVKESVALNYDRKIKAIKNKHTKTIYGAITESMLKNVLKNEELRNVYIKEGKLNIDEVFQDSGILYTFLETLFTTEMIDTKYVNEFVNNI